MECMINNLVSAKYKFAKTMPKTPHHYTLRKTWGVGKDFEDCVQFIRDNGDHEKFYGKEFIYYYLDGFKYWTMGSPVEKTILINRAEV